MTSYQVRLATPADCETLIDFNCWLCSETEDKELDREIVTRGVQRAFEQGDEACYFVAVTEQSPQTVVGSLMLTREWSDWRDGWMAWLQSVYVLADHRGAGVFRLMLEHAATELKKNPDVRGLRLYVELENERAQGAYARNGFKDPNYKVLERMFD
ncbi:MAG: N-acetyltransferase [Planctomycetota bacterium]